MTTIPDDARRKALLDRATKMIMGAGRARLAQLEALFDNSPDLPPPPRLFHVLADRDDFQLVDWNKLSHKPTGLRIVPAPPYGLRIAGDSFVFPHDASPDAVVRRCEAVASE